MFTYNINTWSKIIGAEAIKHNHKIWINEKHLETALGYKNLVSNKTHYFSIFYRSFLIPVFET